MQKVDDDLTFKPYNKNNIHNIKLKRLFVQSFPVRSHMIIVSCAPKVEWPMSEHLSA
jgi:hypothetical protein